MELYMWISSLLDKERLSQHLLKIVCCYQICAFFLLNNNTITFFNKRVNQTIPKKWNITKMQDLLTLADRRHRDNPNKLDPSKKNTLATA